MIKKYSIKLSNQLINLKVYIYNKLNLFKNKAILLIKLIDSLLIKYKKDILNDFYVFLF